MKEVLIDHNDEKVEVKEKKDKIICTCEIELEKDFTDVEIFIEKKLTDGYRATVTKHYNN